MSLIQKAKTDPESFVELYNEYVDRVYAYLVSRIRNTQDSEDLTSKVWEIVLSKLSQLRSSETHSFQAWLFTICRNEVSHYFQSQARMLPFNEEVAQNLPDKQENPHEAAQRNWAKAEVHLHLSALPQQQQETVRLKYLAELKNKEIAELQGISEKTVASNLVRALKTLKKSLQKLQ